MSFANARMYAVTPAVKAHWHRLLGHALRAARLDWPLLDYDAPAPLAALWARDDLGLVMMCGLPFARREPKPVLIAAPIPSPARYGGQPVYFSDIVVRADDPAQTLADTFGRVAGITLLDSYSGGVAWVNHVLQHSDLGLMAYRKWVGGLIHARGVIQALVDGRIDVGPLDSYSHDLLRLNDPALAAKVRSLASTPARPIPPLVATARIDVSALAALRAALCATATEPALRDSLVALQLSGFAVPQSSDYDLLPPLAALAQRAFASFQLAATSRSGTQCWAEVIRRQNIQPQ